MQLQPPMMPRPDLADLGVGYRRIPVLAIGRDLYCDTRLILQKLEQRFPHGALGAQDGEGKALEKLLEAWTVDGGVFVRGTQLIPPDLPFPSDPKFIKDRQEFFHGRSMKKEDVLGLRGEALVHIMQAFDLLETTLLADGREWIRNTKNPSLADIHAIWPLDWVVGLQGALDQKRVSEKQYPRVFAWMARFRKVLKAARAEMRQPITLTGAEVLTGLQKVDFAEPEGAVDDMDPLELQRGQDVLIWPVDAGSTGRDSGKLVVLNKEEVVLQRKTAENQHDIRLHFPRTNFRIALAESFHDPKL
ncbi:hypothetical protein FQN57_007207 [Myotisia sp. PD_48]|nr:hypothetical protein FQN57_007207 [Myotisia sp. PD_48]